ncbi:MAG TPA: NUDIX hydrolase [Pseudonocardiaceae bacterium]|nr:NUDIX hydrolase [Pseudonocardiaceae bacterium]
MDDGSGQMGWQSFGERLLYDNRWVRLSLVDVEAPNGERWEHHVVQLDQVAIAMVVNERDEVLMLHRYRFAVDQWGYELLGGLVEDGEDPAETAAREAVEESGWRPTGGPEHLAGFEPMPGMVRAHTDVYLFRGAEKVGEPTDTEEAGTLEWVPLDRVRQLLQRNELLGGGTIIAVQSYLLSHAT